MKPVIRAFLLGLALLLPAWGTQADESDLRQRLAERLAQPGAVPLRPSEKAARRPAKSAAVSKPAVRWGYTGPGAPEHWAELDPAFRICGVGTRQSPIDLRDTFQVDLDPIRFDYAPVGFSVQDNGHTLHVALEGSPSLTVRGERYRLTHLQFRRPSEERIRGKQFDMSVQLFHRNDAGRWAVLSVLLERGEPQPVVQQVWNHIPLEKGDIQKGLAPLDLTALLPTERPYFTYMGSLTTPPCTEGVLWLVMRQPVGISDQQLGIFEKLYPMNARPIQAGSGRIVKESL
ncbi:MAG: carbonic anhydrase family protein [Inhella sp.]|jgi:carbonic anhydrase|uniref:carbonic anhydrase n=1 Tax=Inhella sp. TaxID=1921806 RepID=UPI0022C6AA07|nr:carbonic anhydrase family protein [Inhella sp.]MCZ8235506.1 carbonic anhydrase family protein [Inhella sp.]